MVKNNNDSVTVVYVQTSVDITMCKARGSLKYKHRNSIYYLEHLNITFHFHFLSIHNS